jgi:hypothetical protein
VQGGGHTIRSPDAPVTFDVQMLLHEEVVYGHLAVGLRDDEDRLIAGWAFEPVFFKAGPRAFHVTVPMLPLRPGNYRLTFSLFSHGNNLTGGRLIESWVGVPHLALIVPPLSHPQDEWAGILNVPATLSGDDAAEARPPAAVTPEFVQR